MNNNSQNSQTIENKLDLNIPDNKESLTNILKKNLEEEKNKISQTSPVYIFCKSLKEINTPNENGWTPLYRSVIANNNLALIELLKLGADPNIPNNLGETPLYSCVENQNYDSLIKLLEYNADPNIPKKNGITPLHLAIKKKLENKYIISLLNKKANPNILNKLYNQTATHLALINKYNEEILQKLCENNADIYGIKDKYDKTPFNYAKELNDSDYLEKVIKIFGKEKENNSDNSIKLIEIKIDDDFLTDRLNDVNLKDINMINGNNYEVDKLNNSFNNFELELNTKKYTSNSNTNNSNKNDKTKNNDNNIYICDDEDKDNDNKNNNNKNNPITPITVNDVDNNHLLSSLNDIDKLNKNNNNSETKNIMSFPEYLKIENSKNINEKINVMYKNINNNDNNSIISKNKNIEKTNEKKHAHNLLSSNKNLNSESLCYSISKEVSEAKNQTQKIKEVENEVEINNKNYTNSSETDKEIIKTIISVTAKKLHQINNYNKKKNENISIFTPEIVNILDNEDKMKSNNLQHSRTSSFVIGNKSSKEEKINNEKDSNLVSITNGSNIFSELQMNTTNSNLNKTKLEEDTLKEKENKISKINTNNSINNNNCKENKETTGANGETDFEINLSISNFNDIQSQNINKQKTKEIEIVNQEIKEENKNNIININNKNVLIDKKNQGQNNNNNHHRQISYHNNFNNKKNKNENDKEKATINNEEENLTDITNKIVDMLREERKSDEINNNIIKSNKKNKDNKEDKEDKENKVDKENKIDKEKEENKVYKENKGNKENKENKENINPNKLKIYHNKNFLAKDRRNRGNNSKKINNPKVINGYKEKTHNNYKYKYNEFKPISIYKPDTKILYNRQRIGRHSSPDYNFNNPYFKKENIDLDNSFKYNVSYISFLNTNSNDKIISNNIDKKKKYNNNKYRIYNPYESFEENLIKKNNSNLVMYRKNKTIFNKKSFYEGNTLNNTTYSSLYNNTSRYNIKPSICGNSIKTNSISNNSNSNRNSNNQNIILSDNNINNNSNSNCNTSGYLKNSNFGVCQMNAIRPHRTISNNLLVRLRDWLISCDLLCYYNILIKNNMYNIDRYIDEIRYNKINISFKDIEELGIKKPGHIFRLLLKLEVDSGKIDNNLYNYIIEKFNNNTLTNNGILTSSVSDVHCCGLNCCTTNHKYNNNTTRRQINTNSNFYNYYNDNNTYESDDDSEDNEINYVDIFSFLKINNLWKFKENFIHNGFDQIEYILIQLFSNYFFDKNILNDYMHIYLEEDKNIVLKVLYKEKKRLCLLLGMKYDNDQLKQILLSQTSSAEYYNYGPLPTNPNIINKGCCAIY